MFTTLKYFKQWIINLLTGCFTVATYYPRWQWLIFPTIRITDTDDTLANAHTLLDRLENECGTAEHLCSTSQLIEDTVS